ncbi:hypothetical protein JTE90_006945 [Oedothorax gibbosus]|uniref:Queuine tRNA-ribosyltransferase accessory subunit 2 n=1 Tax=Oedothorax gibbosus TaxID=931172 RepID=A0AAV6TY52_9ARAC|nr:hypothetical protein JTE90_006945 [Oedothorax gibbosus]
MKFSVKISNFGRIGCISDLPKPWSTKIFKTPAFFTYTRGGTVPHLTHNTLERIEDHQNLFLLQTLPSTIDFKEAVEGQCKGLHNFVGLPEYPFHLSLQDPGTLTPTGYNVTKGMSVFSEGGRKILTPDQFMNTVKAFKPVSYQALSDSDTPLKCSKKRLIKSVDNSIRFLDECLEEHRKCKDLEDTAVFATLQGGYNPFLRKKSAEETAERTVDGYVFDGFHVNGPDVENVDAPKMIEILLNVFPILPEDKLRILHGAFDPQTMLEAVKCGIDVFDSSYAEKLTESGEASIYPLEAVSSFFSKDIIDSVPKRSKFTEKLSLKDGLYKEDFEPILETCNCYTCTHYKRAYIHHLLVTNELLAEILLMVHNMHHMSLFFKQIQNSISN